MLSLKKSSEQNHSKCSRQERKPKARKRVERTRTSFDKSEYERCLQDFRAARIVADQCNLWVMANLVRDSLPEYAERAYDAIRRVDAKRRAAIEQGISSRQIAAEIERSIGKPEVANELDAEASYGCETLAEMKRESRPKVLGALHGKALPGALLYLALLEEHITARIGKRPTPNETAQIASALLAGLGRLPDAGIDPTLLRKRLEQFRKRNPSRLEEMRRLTAANSGEILLDRIYGKAFIADRI